VPSGRMARAASELCACPSTTPSRRREGGLQAETVLEVADLSVIGGDVERHGVAHLLSLAAAHEGFLLIRPPGARPVVVELVEAL
jgi:hypothetical protein